MIFFACIAKHIGFEKESVVKWHCSFMVLIVSVMKTICSAKETLCRPKLSEGGAGTLASRGSSCRVPLSRTTPDLACA